MTTKMPDSTPLSADDDPGEEMRAAADAVPGVEVDPEEDRFGEEREPFERERHADDRAGEAHEAWPEQPELERENGARHGADGEQDGRALGPSLRELEVHGVAGAHPSPLGDHHERGESDADDREDDVEGEGHCHSDFARRAGRALDVIPSTQARNRDASHKEMFTFAFAQVVSRNVLDLRNCLC